MFFSINVQAYFHTLYTFSIGCHSVSCLSHQRTLNGSYHTTSPSIIITCTMHFTFLAVICLFSSMALAYPASNMSHVSRNSLAKRAFPSSGEGIETTDSRRGGRLDARTDQGSALQNPIQMIHYIAYHPSIEREVLSSHRFRCRPCDLLPSA